MRSSQFSRGFSGQRMGIGPGKLSPFIKAVIFVNLAIWIWQWMSPSVTYYLALTPARFFSDFPNLLYQPFTYMFLHSSHSFGHIFFNMFALWMFGTEIEHTWGARKFARFYVLGGLAGALLTLTFEATSQAAMVGASAAIYAILAAYWVMFPNRMLYIYFILPVKVKWAIPGFMLLGIFFGGQDVAHLAHLGGAIFGIAYLKTDWRMASVGARFKNLRRQKQEAKLEKNKRRAEDTMKRVDVLLDKINEVGFENLSKDERKFLEDASSELQNKK